MSRLDSFKLSLSDIPYSVFRLGVIELHKENDLWYLADLNWIRAVVIATVVVATVAGRNPTWSELEGDAFFCWQFMNDRWQTSRASILLIVLKPLIVVNQRGVLISPLGWPMQCRWHSVWFRTVHWSRRDIFGSISRLQSSYHLWSALGLIYLQWSI